MALEETSEVSRLAVEDRDANLPTPKPKNLTVRSWVFTLNNYTDEDIQKLTEFGESGKCKYMVFGYETSKTGTPHLQGYIQIHKQMRMGAVGKMFKWHTEPTRGTPEQASDYCKKDGKFLEFGELSTAAKGAVKGGEAEKERWQNVIQLAADGKMEEIKEQDPQAYLRYYKTLQAIQKDHQPVPADIDDLPGYWIHGAPGVGKSRSVREDLQERGEKWYIKNCNKWWDNYQGEPNVIIDDFDKQRACMGHDLKIWADHYAFNAEIKGSSMPIRPKRIIVTSNYTPEQIWPDDPELAEAIRRRFKFLHMIGYDKTKKIFT